MKAMRVLSCVSTAQLVRNYYSNFRNGLVSYEAIFVCLIPALLLGLGRSRQSIKEEKKIFRTACMDGIRAKSAVRRTLHY